MTTTARGGCACEGVRYLVRGPLRNIINCHCEPCRRITGHFMAASAAATSDLTFDANETLRWFERTPTVQYGFCSTCGSTLFWRADDSPGQTSIAAGTLDQPTNLVTEQALYVAEAADYHSIDESIVSHRYEPVDG